MSNRRSNGGATESRTSKSPAVAVRSGRDSGATSAKSGRDSGATSAKSGHDSGATSAKSGRDSGATSAKSGRNSGATSAKSDGGGSATAAEEMVELTVVRPAAASKPIKYCPRPSRGFSALTDDRGTASADAAVCGPPCCVPNGCAKPEGHYACDRQAARALAHYVTPDERDKVLRWLDALQLGLDAPDADDRSERSMYMTCLLMLLRSGRLVAPFTRPPPAPPRPLKPLRDAVDRRLYKRVQIECRRRRVHERARYALPGDGEEAAADRPSGFFDRMPEPCDGVLCYGAVFSDIA